METNNTPPTGSAPNAETSPAQEPRPREQQDRVIANGITQSRQVLKTLVDDGDLRSALLPKGYDTQEISIGQSLQIAAQTTFNERQRAMGEQDAAQIALTDLVTAARNNYTDFRRVARVRFKAPSDRVKLGQVGNMPDDLQEFVTLATASSTEAASRRMPRCWRRRVATRPRWACCWAC